MSPVTYIFSIAAAVATLSLVIWMLRRGRLRERHAIWWIIAGLAIVVYALIVYGVVSFHDWGKAPQPTDSPIVFVLRNVYVLLALLLLVVLPTRRLVRQAPTSSLPMTGVPVTH